MVVYERYHLALGLLSLLVGCGVAILVRRLPSLSGRAVALAAAAGAVLGSWGSPRGLVWIIPAALLVAPLDDPERSHPLGRFCLPLVIVALVGVWTGVPDTEPPLAAAAALLPIAVVRTLAGRPPGPVATLSVVVAILGAVWVGSAGWGAALASVGAIGLIASAPLVIGFGSELARRQLGVMVAAQTLVGLTLPRLVMSRSVGVAAALAVAVNIVLAAVAHWAGRHSKLRLR